MLTRRQTWRRIKPLITRFHHASQGDENYCEENLLISSKKNLNPVNDMNRIESIENSHSEEYPKEPDPGSPKNDQFRDEILSSVTQSSSFVQIDSVQRFENSSILPLGSSNISLISFTISEQEHARLSEVNTIPPPKAVSFCRTVRVCLVPSRNCLASYCPDLFWSPDDYKTFKDEAIKEIKSVLDARRRVGDKCSPRDVKNALYQPTIYPDLSLSLLAPEEDPLLSEGEQEGVTVVVNLESDFKAEVVHTSSVNRPIIGRPAAARTADPKVTTNINNNNYRGQPTPSQQQYAYPYQLVQQHQQYPQEIDGAATSRNTIGGGRRQLDLTIMPAVLA